MTTLRWYLRISIMDVQDTSQTHLEILTRLQTRIEEIYGRKTQLILPQKGDRAYLQLHFGTQAEFDQTYQGDYEIYSFLLERIINDDLSFPSIGQASSEPKPSQLPTQNEITDDNVDDKSNYLTLCFETDYIAPLRRNYHLTAEINKLLGSWYAYEEIANGFLRFIHTKDDFEDMLESNDEVEGWEQWFSKRGVSLANETIQQFLGIVAQWKKRNP